MTRTRHLMRAALSPNTLSTTQSLQDQLLETRLRIEQAKLAKLEAEIPDPNPKYTRYEDMPPPTPEDEARFHARFEALIGEIISERDEEPLDGNKVSSS